jgi:2-oxoglutarate ferredoxin oxidoreductase subunit beta
VSLALGAEATFVARTIDSDRKHLTSVLQAAAGHQGTALIEIYQNCNIFNDGAFDNLKDNSVRDRHLIRLEHGQPIVFGVEDEQYGIVRMPDATLKAVPLAEAGDAVLIHDAHAEEPDLAFALSRLPDPATLSPTPIGVFRDVDRPTYDKLMTDQLDDAARKLGSGKLADLLAGSDTWTIS